MFTTGFKKTAGIPGKLLNAIGKGLEHPGAVAATGISKAHRALAETGEAAARGIKGQMKATREAYHAGFGPRKNPVTGAIKAEPGAQLAKRRAARALPPPGMSSKAQQGLLTKDIQEGAKSDVQARAAKLHQVKKGPNFAMRHPFVTGLAGLGAAKYIMSGNKSQDGQYGSYPTNPVSPY